MKTLWKKTVTATLIALMAVVAAGCGGDKKAAKQPNELLKAGINNFADSLEPTENYYGWQVTRYAVGECLTKFDNKMAVKPWLAESWKVSDDKLSWTFKIKDNITFSNGKKLTADAVRESLERTFKKAKRATVMFEPESFTADGQELTVKTRKPCATLPGLLGDPLFIIVDATEESKRDFARQGPVCTGPYTVTSFSKAKCVVEANQRYWDGKVPYKRIEINTINDPHDRAITLQKGEIDIAVNVGAGDLQLFKDKNKYNVSEITSFCDVLVHLNQSKGKPLADKRIRRALIRALDRETYSKALLKDTFIPGAPLMPPVTDYGFPELISQNPDPYNIESVKKLLAEAGWKDTNRDGFVDKDGKNLELDYYFCSDRAELPLFAEATQSDARLVGIKINLKNVDRNMLYKIGATGDYDLLLSDILTLTGGDPEYFMNVFFRTNNNGDTPENTSGYSNPEYDKLSARLSGEFDTAKRRDIVIKMQRIMMDDAGTLVYGYPKTNTVSRKGIENASVSPADFYWLTKDIRPAEK